MRPEILMSQAFQFGALPCARIACTNSITLQIFLTRTWTRKCCPDDRAKPIAKNFRILLY